MITLLSLLLLLFWCIWTTKCPKCRKIQMTGRQLYLNGDPRKEPFNEDGKKSYLFDTKNIRCEDELIEKFRYKIPTCIKCNHCGCYYSFEYFTPFYPTLWSDWIKSNYSQKIVDCKTCGGTGDVLTYIQGNEYRNMNCGYCKGNGWTHDYK